MPASLSFRKKNLSRYSKQASHTQLFTIFAHGMSINKAILMGNVGRDLKSDMSKGAL